MKIWFMSVKIFPSRTTPDIPIFIPNVYEVQLEIVITVNPGQILGIFS